MMRTLLFAAVMAATVPIYGQNFFLQLQPEAGFSSFSSGILPFDLSTSFQFTFSGGVQHTDHSALKVGIGLQQAGASSKVFYSTPGAMRTEVLQHPVVFIKIPVDYSLRLGSRGRFTLDLGAYYNLNINSLLEDWVVQDDFLTLAEEDLTKDDVGLRIRPAIEIPYTPRIGLSFGILQEIGLVAFVPRTHHYNTYFTAGVKLKL